MRNVSEKDVFRVGTYQLKIHGENKLVLHGILYALGVQCSLVPFFSSMRLGFSFDFHPNGLDIFL